MNKLIVMCALMVSTLMSAASEEAEKLLTKHELSFVMRSVRNNSNHTIRILDNSNDLIATLNPDDNTKLNRRFDDFDPVVEHNKEMFQSGSFSVEFSETDIDELWVTVNFRVQGATCEIEATLNEVSLELGTSRQLDIARLRKTLSKSESNRFYIDVEIQPVISQSRVSVHVSEKSESR
jgi:hypothetical protein